MCERTNLKQCVLTIWAVEPHAGQPRHVSVDFSTAVEPRSVNAYQAVLFKIKQFEFVGRFNRSCAPNNRIPLTDVSRHVANIYTAARSTNNLCSVNYLIVYRHITHPST